ncbi:MAG TPA: NUDIX domain-containing protein [Nitrolancea sp.]|nr:NUDIX domain-containing protein [Nitrolancea sp.]
MDFPTCTVHKLVADVALFSTGQIALVRYRDPAAYDRQAGWFLPDDYLAYLEHPDAAARRIVAEQLGLTDVVVALDHIESFKGNDASWHLIFHYAASLDSIPTTVQSDTLAQFQWFPLDALPERGAVAHHGWALDVIAAIRTNQPFLFDSCTGK